MDFGDPRESVISLDTPATWEADNRVEQRWQWGAQLLDLCDLSPEDYKNSTAVTVKTIQDCGECGSGGGGGQVENNQGVGVMSNSGQFTVSYASAVSSTFYVFVTFKDNDGNEYSFRTTMPKGSNSATYDATTISTALPLTITSIKLGFEEDGSDAADSIKDKKYEYDITFEGDVAGKTYISSILCTKTDTLTDEDFINIIEKQGHGYDYIESYDEVKFEGTDTAQAVFYAPCTYVDAWMPDDVEEQYFAEHSYDFVVLTEKLITEIKEDITTDTENWSQSTIVLNGVNFNKWIRRDLSGAQCPYSIGDNSCEDYELTYTLKIKD
jgi:hypothetical protein